MTEEDKDNTELFALRSAWMQESEAIDNVICADDAEVVFKKMLKALDLDSSLVKGVVV